MSSRTIDSANNNNNTYSVDKTEVFAGGSSHKRKCSAPKRIYQDGNIDCSPAKRSTLDTNNDKHKEYSSSVGEDSELSGLVVDEAKSPLNVRKPVSNQTCSENHVTKNTNGHSRLTDNLSNERDLSPLSRASPTTALDLSNIRPRQSEISCTKSSVTTVPIRTTVSSPVATFPDLLSNLNNILGLNGGISHIPTQPTNGTSAANLSNYLLSSILMPQLTSGITGVQYGGGQGIPEMASLLHSLPVPSIDMPSYQILYTNYVSIITEIHQLMRLIERYNSGIQIAQKAAQETAQTQSTHLSIIQATSSAVTSLISPQKTATPRSIQDRGSAISSPDTTTVTKSQSIGHSQPRRIQGMATNPVTTAGSGSNGSSGSQPLNSWRSIGASRKGRKPDMMGKKSNFRGTCEMENTVDPKFKDIEAYGNKVVLSEEYPSVTMQRETYDSILAKCTKSATRLIRLLMKHFFTQTELAASSLSGEGIYKQRLSPEITGTIKAFIRRRHPYLKTGTMSLCMTDVCVQARRVANNQRARTSTPSTTLQPSSVSIRTPPPLTYCGEEKPKGTCQRNASPLLPPLAIPSNPNPKDMFPADS